MYRKLYAAVVASLVLCASTAAEISDKTIDRYNAAAQGSDTEELVSAAARLGEEAIASPEYEHATLLAYEAAWAMCRNGECRQAIPAAEFAAAQPETGGHPTLADRNLLAAYAAWKAHPNKKTRTALDQQLHPRIDDVPNMLTVTAFQSRLMDDLSNTRHKQAETSATQAARHFYPARAQIARLWSGAELAVHTSTFNDRQAPGSIVGIAELGVELHRIWHTFDEPPDWLEDRYYTNLAWLRAMDAYFTSTDEAEEEREEADRIHEDSLGDHADMLSSALTAHDDSGPPTCDGDLNRQPRPRYPRSAAMGGYIGAVIVQFDVDEDGNLKPHIAASVPNDKFDKAVLKSFHGVKWKWEEPAEGEEPCVKELHVIVPFEFVLDQ